jgi:hypothetical protein
METDEMRDGKSDQAIGRKAQSGDRRMIEMVIGWGSSDRVDDRNGDRMGIK